MPASSLRSSSISSTVEAVALGPARVHAQEHLGPVAGLGAAGAGLDLEEGVAGVLRAAEHGPQLEVVELLLEPGQFLLQLGFEAGVLLGQLARGRCRSPRGRRQLLEGLEQAVERLELLR